jgi:hypothetical protein
MVPGHLAFGWLSRQRLVGDCACANALQQGRPAALTVGVGLGHAYSRNRLLGARVAAVSRVPNCCDRSA